MNTLSILHDGEVSDRIRCLLLAAGGTYHYSDRVRNAALIRGCKPGEREAFIRALARYQREWLDYLTVSQRRWQRETRRPSRARHHDSISIREKYVRAGVTA